MRGRDNSQTATNGANGANDHSNKDATEQDGAETEDPNSLASNALCLVAVYIVGTVAWFISYKAGAWDADEPAPDSPTEVNNPLEWAGLTLGYISAVLYLW